LGGTKFFMIRSCLGASTFPLAQPKNPMTILKAINMKILLKCIQGPPFLADRNIKPLDLYPLQRIIFIKFEKINYVSLLNSRNGDQFQECKLFLS
jgi:hypothetical protein